MVPVRRAGQHAGRLSKWGGGRRCRSENKQASPEAAPAKDAILGAPGELQVLT